MLAEAMEKARKNVSLASSAFKKFQKKYRLDPAGFSVDCIEHDEGIALYQMEILEALPVETRVAVRAPHGAGKTALAAWVILWGVLTADDCKVPTTASAWRQLTHFLWPEVHKWAGKLKWDVIGRPQFHAKELLTQSLKRAPNVEAFAVASDRPELIEGAHAKRIVYIYDEAKSIGDDTFNASEGAFSTAGVRDYEAFALAISTPGDPHGRFYDIHNRAPGLEGWWTRHITLEETIEAERVSRKWASDMSRLWGVNSAVYQNRVLGEFATSGTSGVIPLAWVELAIERWHEWVAAGRPGTYTGVGVDVGGGGEGADLTVMAECWDGEKIDTLREFSHVDPTTATMQVAGRVKGILDVMIDSGELVEGANGKMVPLFKPRGGIAVIDSIGIGAGTVHRLNEMGMENVVRGFGAGEGTDHKDLSGEMGFINKRAAGWWIMREMLDPANGYEVALPPDDALIGELTAPTFREMSGGKIKVESKDDIKKRLNGRSTDHADAVMHILARQLVGDRVAFLGFI
jgi:hypothetical protein